MPAEARYQLTPLARRDLEEIWSFTAERWSERQADDYIRMIVDAFFGIAERSKQGREVEVHPGYLKYRIGAHIVYHRWHADDLVIVRVLHSAMDVDRHL